MGFCGLWQCMQPHLPLHYQPQCNIFMHDYIQLSASNPTTTGALVTGDLSKGETARLQYALPQEGITIKIRVMSGHLVFYTSTVIKNPNSAYNDRTFECAEDCDIHVMGPMGSGGNQNTVRRQVTEVEPVNTILYVSVEGLDNLNSFELNTDAGDSTSPPTLGMLLLCMHIASDCMWLLYVPSSLHAYFHKS